MASGLLAMAAATALQATSGPNVSRGRPLGAAVLPSALDEAVSLRLGASEPAYRPRRSGAAILTSGGGIRGTFRRAGADLRVATGDVELRLAGVAQGHRLARVAPSPPAVAGGKVVYERRGISEVFRNGPLGVEQAFEVASPAPGARSGLAVSIALGGSLEPSRHGSEIAFSSTAGAVALRYGGLAALDAAGRRLPARMVLEGHTLRLVVDDRNAHYPILIDPWVQQGPRLTPGGTEEQLAGLGVALSADGNTALVGAVDADGEAGAAYVFTRSNGIWSEQAKITGGTEESGKGSFGRGVALSADGNTALVGAWTDHLGVGAAFVFTRSNGAWSQQGPKLTASGEHGPGLLGFRVAISGDGNTALLGASGDSGETGAAFVFVRSGSTWSQQAELTGSGTKEFGTAVGLSSDGNVAVTGALGSHKVFFFTRSGTTWTEQASITQADGSFGYSGALSEAGDTAVIGAPFQNAAWVLTRTGSSWTSYAYTRLTGSGEFGSAVAIDGKGNHVLVGAPAEEGHTGASYVFARSGGGWSEEGPATSSSESGEAFFGEATALSGDGGTALVGAPDDGSHVGAAWVFSKQKINPLLLMHLVAGPKIVQPGEPVQLGGSWTLALPGLGDVICANSTLGGSMIDNGFKKDALDLASATFADEAPGVCTSTSPLGLQATVTAGLAAGAPYPAVLNIGGTAQLNGNPKVTLTVQFEGAPAPAQCTWQASRLKAVFARAGAPVSLQFKEQTLKLVKALSSAGCSSKALLTATTQLSGFDEFGRPQPVYLESAPGG